MADLFSQQLGVGDVHVAATELQRTPALEIDEHAVDRDTCRADERGDLFLRELHAAVTASELVLVDEALRDASRKVEEDEVLDVAGAAADAPREEREQLAHRGGGVVGDRPGNPGWR